jgi:hypothetical protein
MIDGERGVCRLHDEPEEAVDESDMPVRVGLDRLGVDIFKDGPVWDRLGRDLGTGMAADDIAGELLSKF